MSVYYFSGKETFLKKQELKKILDGIECHELNVASWHEPDPAITEFIASYPFIGGKKAALLHFFPEEEDLAEGLSKCPDFTDVYIVVSEMPDRRKNAVKTVLSFSKEKEFGKISEQTLWKSICSRLKKTFPEEEVLRKRELLMECFSAYFKHADMDLEVVQKHLRLIAMSGALSDENIRTFAPDSSDYRAFTLSQKILAKDDGCIDFAVRLLEQGETAVGLFSLVAYQIRICYKALLYKEEKFLPLIGIRDYQLYSGYADYSVRTYKELYSLLMDGIRRVKNGENPSVVMVETLSRALGMLK